AVGERLEDPVGAGAVRSYPVLHVGDDLAQEPDGQHHRDEEHAEGDEDLDGDDDHRAEVDSVRKERVGHQVTFSTSISMARTDQSTSAEALVSWTGAALNCSRATPAGTPPSPTARTTTSPRAERTLSSSPGSTPRCAIASGATRSSWGRASGASDSADW